MHTAKSQPKHIRRTFCDLPHEKIFDIEHISMLADMGFSGTFGWDELLKSQYILIISESGAGKTYECQEQQKALWDNGDPAFYLELAELAKNDLRTLLSSHEKQRLDAWLVAQADTATFFLDSIDELKLTRGSFRTALNRLNETINGRFHRARIIITTRPTPVDRQLIEDFFPVSKPIESVPSGEIFADVVMRNRQQDVKDNGGKVPPPRRYVALTPLSNQLIREMAVSKGVVDSDRLLADIHQRNAEDFARRPQGGCPGRC